MRRKLYPLNSRRKKLFRGFWSGPIKTQEDVETSQPMAEILIFDVIGRDFWGDGIDGKSIRSALKELGNGDVRVRINSPGGDTFEGVAIHNALRDHKGKVQVVIDALAASAAALIAMAGDEILMVENATFMIHEPWTFALGDATELRAQADILETINSGLITTFARRTGQSREAIGELLQAETWLGAEEALEGGFVDEVVEPGGIRNEFDKDVFSKPKPRGFENVQTFLEGMAEGEEEPKPGTPEFRAMKAKDWGDKPKDADTPEDPTEEGPVDVDNAARARTEQMKHRARILKLDN